MALAESLAVVGLVVPGAAIVVGAGALIALGAMSFWTTLLAAAAGAIVGDGISFWIGRRYRDQLRSAWPFRRHPEWLANGEGFLHRHGGKSVLFGRFVGPVRPIIPVVAGMLGMRPAMFYAMNVTSAFAWAPAYLLPGMAVGASLALANLVAARLAAMLALVTVLIWLLLWAMRAGARAVSPRAATIAKRLLAWGNLHPRLNAIFGGILDPAGPEARTLVVMAAVLIGATWLFFGVLEDVVTGDALVRVDESVYQLLQALRTPWGDRVMVFVAELGDGIPIALVAAVIFAWLLWCKNGRAAAYWAAAIGFGQVAALAIKFVLQRPRPAPGLYDGLSSYAFPSSHAVMSTVAYGFLAVLVARFVTARRRWLVYALAVLPVSLIAVSQLYLGAHWLSDVLGGVSLGLIWVCVLGVAFYRHPAAKPVPHGLPAVAVLALALSAGWHVARRYSADLERHAPRTTIERMDASHWWQQNWQRLPAYRGDLEGDLEQPLNVQWAGSLASLRAKLRRAGWQEPVPLGPSTALRWLLPAPRLEQLPLLPEVHDGRHESLVMLGPDAPVAPTAGVADRKGRLVLRVWSTDTVLGPGSTPLWVGSALVQELRSFVFLTVPVNDRGYETALEQLSSAVEGLPHRTVIRGIGATEGEIAWSGRVLLINDESG